MDTHRQKSLYRDVVHWGAGAPGPTARVGAAGSEAGVETAGPKAGVGAAGPTAGS